MRVLSGVNQSEAASRQRSSARVFGALLIVGLGVLAAPLHSAHAQDADQAEAEADAEDAAKRAESKRAAKMAAPPAALPGAESNEGEAGHSNMDIEPTAALFESIDRGSLSAAKEALGRGADMNGKNVLGQTPLDMAIDLNRNDIMFFLLSMRGLDTSQPTTTTTVDSGSVKIAGGSGSLTIGGKASRGNKAGAMAVVDRRYDASGGAARPAEGFLGFGGS
ncbi:ankyrin repeat domain-containing protein [Acetobacter sacchari]|uniref:ankyrin repeat domain-containing protein n=1 Tax=Acetobacter sacchari TaxID=2661687 RepID=UPI001FAFF073|nr:ankyrin repeat domain-containing protein [Acetobacter sacchari]